jgi:hypothetical protein
MRVTSLRRIRFSILRNYVFILTLNILLIQFEMLPNKSLRGRCLLSGTVNSIRFGAFSIFLNNYGAVWSHDTKLIAFHLVAR